MVVPRHGEGGRLARALAQGIREALTPLSLGLAFGGAVLGTALMCIPVVGVWLFAALVAAGAWVYQALIREGTPYWVEEDDRARRVDVLVRALLSLVSAAAVLAPILIRNGGAAVPRGRALGSPWAILVSYLVLWLAVPVLLTAANAHDRNGPMRLRRVCATFLARPRGTLATFLLAPIGLLAVELGVVFLAIEQTKFPMLLNNAFPTPRVTYEKTRFHLVYHFDNCVWNVPFENSGKELVPIYLSGLRRGYSLLAEIPVSLTLRYPRSDPSIYQSTMFEFLAFRLAFSVLGLTGAVSVLGAQARCLGRLVAAGIEADIAASARTGLTVIPSLRVPAGAPDAASPVPGHGDGERELPPPDDPVAAASARTGLIPIPPTGNPAGASAHTAVIAIPPNLGPTAAASARTGRMPTPPDYGRANATSAVPPPSPTGLRTVLIIDDEAVSAQALGQILADQGFAISIAVNGRDGLALAAATRPALIILDLLLPDRSGFDVCRALRTSPLTQSIPILMLSARDDADDEVTGLEQGADDYVAKPYIVEVLLARIRKQLRLPAIGNGATRKDGARTNGSSDGGSANS